jgi:hypothetical protein
MVFHKDSVTMLITGIGLLVIPLIVLSSHAMDGTFTSIDQEWRGILGTLLLVGFACWAIWDGLTASPPSPEQPTPRS